MSPKYLIEEERDLQQMCFISCNQCMENTDSSLKEDCLQEMGIMLEILSFLPHQYNWTLPLKIFADVLLLHFNNRIIYVTFITHFMVQ
jgi:hypothetical protein